MVGGVRSLVRTWVPCSNRLIMVLLLLLTTATFVAAQGAMQTGERAAKQIIAALDASSAPTARSRL